MAAIEEAYIQGVATRLVEELIESARILISASCRLWSRCARLHLLTALRIVVTRFDLQPLSAVASLG